MQFKFPTSADRQFVCGRTGSGKTVAACWNLSNQNFRSAPWCVFNPKGTELIDSIEGAHHVDLNYVPKKPGIYIYHPVPENDDESVTKLLWKVYGRGNTGVYFDEMAMTNPRDPAVRALLTQGREKRIPMIMATQRPVGVSRYAISESDYFQVFQMTDDKDLDRVREFIPIDLRFWMKTKANEVPKLGAFFSLWYDVKRNYLFRMGPVPDEQKLLEKFKEALQPPKRKGRIFL